MRIHCDEQKEQWGRVRDEFLLDKSYIHLSLPVINPHPEKVKKAIEEHRTGFDTNPGKYFKKKDEMQHLVLESAARYLGTSPQSIALTESTTMGLTVVYGGMKLYSGEEILTSEHEHYACREILRFKARDSHCLVRRIALYDDPLQACKKQMVNQVIQNIFPFTRVVALTWVHSSTGVKIPLVEIGEEIKKINRSGKKKKRCSFALMLYMALE